MQLHDTIAAIATPAGRGGIGEVRLSRIDSLAIAARVLRLGTSLADRHATLATLPDEELAAHAADFARDTERRTR